MAIALTASVGKGGKNVPVDVTVVRGIMMSFVPGSITSVLTDPKCTPDLEEAIRSFQAIYTEKPDGRIDPGKGTEKRINVLLAQGLAKYHKVPVGAQTTLKKCWEASARMMLKWRNGSDRIHDPELQAFAAEDVSRQEHQMDWFNKRLGMVSVPKPKGLDLLKALANGPVLINTMDRTSGHAGVVTGYDHIRGYYKVNNPAGFMVVDFGDSSKDGAQGAALDVVMWQIEKALGDYLWHW